MLTSQLEQKTLYKAYERRTEDVPYTLVRPTGQLGGSNSFGAATGAAIGAAAGRRQRCTTLCRRVCTRAQEPGSSSQCSQVDF